MPKVQKINVLLFAKFQAILFGLIGILAGLIYSFGGLIIDVLVSVGWITSQETLGLSYGTVLAFGALIGMPIIATTFGFITGIIGAYLYNLTSKWFGGIEINIKK